MTTRYMRSLAAPQDDAELRRLMSGNRIDGMLALSLRREPSYFAAARLQGEAVQVIVIRDRVDGRVVAMASRAVGPAFIAGRTARVALYADLRIDPAHRGGTLLPRIFEHAGALNAADPLPAFSLVYEDNVVGKRSLLSARAGIPRYRREGRLACRAVLLRHPRPELQVPGVTLRRASAAELPAIIAFLNRTRATRPLAPILAEGDFEPGGRCATLRTEDFFVAHADGTRLVATIAAWDQSALRQVHVERYPRALAWLRPVHNLYAGWRRWPRLPGVGEAVPFVYLAFVAAENDDLRICASLWRHAYNSLCHGRRLHALVGLHERDPLASVFTEYPGMDSPVGLYAIEFPGAPDPLAGGGVPGVEFALT